MSFRPAVTVVSLSITFALLGGCHSDASNTAPARLKEPLVLKDQPSTIRLPVAFPLDELQTLINQEIPRELHKIDEPEKICVKTKSKLIPDISCRLVGSVTRGPMTLTGQGSDLILAMPVTATVQARDIAGVIKRETATGSIKLRARIRLGLRPDWTPTAKVTADYDWADRLGIDFLGQRLTFASKVDPKLRELLANLERTLPKHLARLRLREKVQPVWSKGFTAVRVKSDPLIWVRFTPQQVGFSGYRADGRQLIVGFSARAKTETIFGERPADPPVTPLPRLMGALPPTGVNVHVPVLVAYDVMEREARKALLSSDYRALKLQGGTVDAVFHNVHIYGAPDNRVAIGVDMSLKSLAGVISTKGTVWFIARPAVDIPRRVVGISDVVVSGQTDSKAFNLLLSAINATSLRQKIVDLTRYDFTREYDEGLRKADAWLEEQPFEGFVFRGDLDGAQITGVRIAPDGLLIEADARADAAMTYNPARAAVLVKIRRAKRAARLARQEIEAAAAAGRAAEAARRNASAPR